RILFPELPVGTLPARAAQVVDPHPEGNYPHGLIPRPLQRPRPMSDTPLGDTPLPVGAPARPSLARRLRLPRLSGKVSAAWLVCCFALTAVLIPMALRLPRWVEFEIVLAAWWAIWLAVLAGLLYTGRRVTDDHRLGEPRNWFSSGKARRLADKDQQPAPD